MPSSAELRTLIGEIKENITRQGQKLTARLDAIETAGKTAGERLSALEKADKEINEALEGIKGSTPARGGVRDAVFGALDDTKKARALLNEQVRFFCSVDPTKGFDEERAKALQIAIGPAGGFLVPVTFEAEVKEKIYRRGIMLPNIDLITNAPLQGNFNKEDGDWVWSSVGELAQPTETTFTDLLKQLSWSLKEKGAFATISNHLLKHAPFDIANFMTRKAARSLSKKQDDWFFNGTGFDEPRGVRIGEGVNTVSQLGANYTYDDLVELEFAQPEEYRSEMAIFLTSKALKLIAKLKDSNGYPIILGAHQTGVGALKTDWANSRGWLQITVPYPFFVMKSTQIPENLGGGSNETEVWAGVGEMYRGWEGEGMEASQDSAGENWRKNQTQVKFLVNYDGVMVHGEAWTVQDGVK